MWVIAALCILAVSMFAVHRMGRLSEDSAPDLGSVTERWLVEHRTHQSDESR
jgi:hypothetical protein